MLRKNLCSIDSMVITNPGVEHVPVVELEIDDTGSPRDRLVFKPIDNKSCLAGAHYNPAVNSLSARLNVGVPLEKVSIGCTENDPNVLYRAVNRFINAADQALNCRVEAAKSEHEKLIADKSAAQLAALSAAAAVNPETIVTSSKSE